MENDLSTYRFNKNNVIRLMAIGISNQVSKARGSVVSITTSNILGELNGGKPIIGYIAWRGILKYFLDALVSKGYMSIYRKGTKKPYNTARVHVYLIPKRLKHNIPNPLFSTNPELIYLFLKGILSNVD
ncbi:MAG: hypothetical protein RXN93_08810 [Thermocladium sp.]